MDKETLIAKARAIADRNDLFNLLNEIKADLLGDKTYPFTRKQFLILCNPKNDKYRYHSFEIPKKSGDFRQIFAPCRNLKWLQLCLNEIFKALYTPSPYTMGFTEGKSIVENARIHTNQNYVFNIDLKAFFPSIDQARVWKRLQLTPFCFNAKVAGVIAGLCSIKSLRYSVDEPFQECFVLPQGAPTSPLLSNAVCDTLDRRLHGLAKRFGLHYSRYADDITFSSMHNVYQQQSAFRNELERVITEQHFTINNAKTRLRHCSTRQEVTGLTVGAKINVSRKYVKDVRAILHIWEKYGYNAAFATFYPRYNSEKCQLRRGTPDLSNVISGKLCYLKMVKGEKDAVYFRLHSQFARLIGQETVSPKNPGIEYLFTMAKTDFEKKLGVSIEFRQRTRDKKQYGCFCFQDRFFVVAVSKNLNLNELPSNTEISLTRTTSLAKFNNRRDTSLPTQMQAKTRVCYLLHKPLGNYRTQTAFYNIESVVSDELKSFIIQIADTYPELQPRNEMNITESARHDNLLDQLVNSNFDLSILS